MSYVADLAAARKAYADADAACRKAIMNSAPMPPELATLAERESPVRYAAFLVNVAETAAQVPALSDAREVARAALAPIEAQSCRRCDGTGIYSAPTSYRRNGNAYCFTCDGTGKA